MKNSTKQAFNLVNEITKDLGWKTLPQSKPNIIHKPRKPKRATIDISHPPERIDGEKNEHYKIRLMQYYLDNRSINIDRAEQYANKIMKQIAKGQIK